MEPGGGPSLQKLLMALVYTIRNHDTSIPELMLIFSYQQNDSTIDFEELVVEVTSMAYQVNCPTAGDGSLGHRGIV